MAISDSGLLFGVAMVLAPELTIAIVWVVAAPKYPQLRAVNAEVAAFVCASDLPQVDSVFLGLFYAYNAILLIVCAMLAFLTRNVSDSYSETSMIGYSVYNACGTIIVLVPLLMAGVINNPTVNFWLKAILMIYPTMFGFSILFGERLFFRVWRAETSEAPSETDYSIAMQNGFDVFTHASPSKVLASLENGKELSTRSSSLRGKVTCKNHFSGVSFGLHSCPVIVLNKKSLIARWELRLGVLYDANLIILFHAGRKEPPRVESVIMMLYWNVGRQVNDKENNIYSIELSEREPVNSSKQPSSFPYDGHKERTKWCNLIIDFTSEEHFLKWSSILSHSAEQTNTPTNVLDHTESPLTLPSELIRLIFIDQLAIALKNPKPTTSLISPSSSRRSTASLTSWTFSQTEETTLQTVCDSMTWDITIAFGARIFVDKGDGRGEQAVTYRRTRVVQEERFGDEVERELHKSWED
ncbi:hypothetical protein BJ742DRAFT_778550 [Cladochytrium replicatum]|nr:hypothetical protein BJ742DRAFT_778550 [Cladochytrium replicatum]